MLKNLGCTRLPVSATFIPFKMNAPQYNANTLKSYRYDDQLPISIVMVQKVNFRGLSSITFNGMFMYIQDQLQESARAMDKNIGAGLVTITLVWLSIYSKHYSAVKMND